MKKIGIFLLSLISSAVFASGMSAHASSVITLVTTCDNQYVSPPVFIKLYSETSPEGFITGFNAIAKQGNDETVFSKLSLSKDSDGRKALIKKDEDGNVVFQLSKIAPKGTIVGFNYKNKNNEMVDDNRMTTYCDRSW